MFNGSSIFAAPAYPLEEVFDPTGAGDTFAGGFMGYLANTGDISEAGIRQAITATMHAPASSAYQKAADAARGGKHTASTTVPIPMNSTNSPTATSRRWRSAGSVSARNVALRAASGSSPGRTPPGPTVVSGRGFTADAIDRRRRELEHGRPA